MSSRGRWDFHRTAGGSWLRAAIPPASDAGTSRAASASTPAFTQNAGSYTFSPDGQRLLALSNEDIQLIATDNGQPIVTVAGQIPFQIPGEFLPDGQSWIAGSYDTTLTRRDVNTGGIINTFRDIPAR